MDKFWQDSLSWFLFKTSGEFQPRSQLIIVILLKSMTCHQLFSSDTSLFLHLSKKVWFFSCSKPLQKGYIIDLVLLLKHYSSFLWKSHTGKKISQHDPSHPLWICSCLRTFFTWRPFLTRAYITHCNKNQRAWAEAINKTI